MSESKDLFHRVNQKLALKVQLISTDTTTVGEILDRQGYESLTYFPISGILTDGTYNWLVEDGDAANLSDAAAVSDDFLLGTEAAMAMALTDDDKVAKIGYIGVKRFNRISCVSTVTTTGGTLGAIALLGFARHAPDTIQLQA